ncbi:39S ribosomal protein L44, mitochondrial, partial [Stegodyphus mimosarum]
MAFCGVLLNARNVWRVNHHFIIKNSVFASVIGNTEQKRSYGKGYAKFLKCMKLRRKIAGPDRVRRRNEWFNWNYEAELYGFVQRLHENITENTLRCAFIHDSYIQLENEKRKELDMPLQDVQLDIKSNSALISLGYETTSNYLKKYLRHCFQFLPEEGLCALHDHLLSDEVLSHISFNIGTSELIFCAEYPPSKSTLADTLKAIIGAISSEDGVARAENFVLDFICPQLIAKDVFEIWDLEDPLSLLNSILRNNGCEPSESRLIFESGRNTLEAIYHVGLYSNKEFLGRGPGETLAIAEEMAAYDALRRLFRVAEHEKPLPFGLKCTEIDFHETTQQSSVSQF